MYATEYKSSMRIHLLQGSTVSTKVLFNTFATMGQRNKVTSYKYNEAGVEIELGLSGFKPFDPRYFAEIARENKMVLKKITHHDKQWDVQLDASGVQWNITAITPNEGASMGKTTVAEWFNAQQCQTLNIEAPYSGKWYPDIAVLDANMEVLSFVRSFTAQDKMNFTLPDGAVYLKVANTNGMKLLKEGMWIEGAADEY